MDYFNNLFSSNQTLGNEAYFKDIRCKVTSEMNAELTKEVSSEEIRRAAFSIRPDRAPGPDGVNGAFYQKYWSIVSEAITKEVK